MRASPTSLIIGEQCNLLLRHRLYCFCASGATCPSPQGKYLDRNFILISTYFPSLVHRWLLARGRVDELAVIIEKASLWNNRILSRNFKRDLLVPQTDANRRVSILDLFQKGYKRTTFLMTVVWFSIILIYFGITLHMSSLGGNVYINTVS